MLCHCFGCPNVLLCFSAHALLVFSYLQMVTARDFGAIPPIPVFCAKLTWILAGWRKTQLLELGMQKDLVLPGHPCDGNCPRAPLVGTGILGELGGCSKKEGNQVLSLLFLLFTSCSWNLVEVVFCTAEILFLINPVPVLGIYLALSPVHYEKVHF